MRYIESKQENHALADLRGVTRSHIDSPPLTVAGVGVGVGEKPIAPSKLEAQATPPSKTFLELKTLQQPFVVSDRDVAEWKKLYPAVDVEQAVRNMCGWLDADPRRRKSHKGVPRFVHNWLRGDQDKGRTVAKPSPVSRLTFVDVQEHAR